ncbi:MAG: DUF4399 domain-containing protein [Maricaulaceae bacterium]
MTKPQLRPLRAPASLFAAPPLLAALLLSACAPADTGPDAAPHASAEPMVYFVNLEDGDVVDSPVRVVFGLSGMGVAPAAADVPDTGHHHLLVDADGYPTGEPLPNNETYRHFGGGQTETVLELSPGEHSLQLVFADRGHVPFEPSIESEVIRVAVR